jgi:hypothetical protein
VADSLTLPCTLKPLTFPLMLCSRVYRAGPLNLLLHEPTVFFSTATCGFHLLCAWGDSQRITFCDLSLESAVTVDTFEL